MTHAAGATPGSSGLLPGPLDRVLARVAPAWSSPVLGDAPGGAGRQLLRPLLWLLLGVVAVQSVLHLVDAVVFDLRIDRFNANQDQSLAGWLGTVTTCITALAALLLALLARGVRRPLLVLAGLCAFLSFDDMVRIHEIAARQQMPLFRYDHDGQTLWVAVYLPLMAVVAWLLLRTARSVDPGTGRYAVAGLACLAGAVLLEGVVAPVFYVLGSEHGRPLIEGEVLFEEALESSGWGLLALGLLCTCVDLLLHRGAVQAAAVPRGRT